MASAAALTLLLPPVARLVEDGEASGALGRALARADELPRAAPGREARLRAWFDTGREPLVAAPLTRWLDASDASEGRWLRADPAHVAADLATARLLACGGLGVTDEERIGFERALKPLFGDAGLEFSAPHPDRWYLRMRSGAELPECSPPEQALGADLAAHLPRGLAGQRFQRLMNEAQMLLHQHPANTRRAERDAPSVNSVWFWGGGELPKRVAGGFKLVASVDPVVAALARLAGASHVGVRRYAELPEASGAILADVQELRARDVMADWLEPARAALGAGRLAAIEVAVPDGRGFRLEHAQRWRVWRRARALS